MLQLKDGWELISEFWEKPLALVLFRRGEVRQRARFDADKKMFIDRPPADVPDDIRAQLARSLNAQILR